MADEGGESFNNTPQDADLDSYEYDGISTDASKQYSYSEYDTSGFDANHREMNYAGQGGDAQILDGAQMHNYGDVPFESALRDETENNFIAQNPGLATIDYTSVSADPEATTAHLGESSMEIENIINEFVPAVANSDMASGNKHDAEIESCEQAEHVINRDELASDPSMPSATTTDDDGHAKTLEDSAAVGSAKEGVEVVAMDSGAATGDSETTPEMANNEDLAKGDHVNGTCANDDMEGRSRDASVGNEQNGIEDGHHAVEGDDEEEEEEEDFTMQDHIEITETMPDDDEEDAVSKASTDIATGEDIPVATDSIAGIVGDAATAKEKHASTEEGMESATSSEAVLGVEGLGEEVASAAESSSLPSGSSASGEPCGDEAAVVPPAGTDETVAGAASDQASTPAEGGEGEQAAACLSELEMEQKEKDSTTTNAIKEEQKSTEKSSGAVNKVPKVQQECVVCKKMSKPKYNIVRNGDTKHLCDDDCFKMFRLNPTSYLQALCTNTEKSDPPCDLCEGVVPVAARTKYILKMGLGKPCKRFCQQICLDDFRKQMKPCAACGKDVRHDPNAFIAPVDGDFRDFCSHSCLVRYEASRTTVAGAKKTAGQRGATTLVNAKCTVCSKMGIVMHEVNFGGKLHKMCGTECFTAFRSANKLSMKLCKICNNVCPASEEDGSAALHQVQFEGESIHFCSTGCASKFKEKRTRTVACTWCNTRKNNFDMVESDEGKDKSKLFCSLNCLSLYRVNLQANSNNSVSCDQCHKAAPPQYHLTMSDASVRNFCGYNCVMAFQSQFSQPSVNSGHQLTAGQQVTANTAHGGTRQSARSAARAKAVPSPAGRGRPSVMSDISSSNYNKGVSTANYQQHIMIQPPAPKSVKNKALLCKPIMQTKATSCRPSTVTKATQTDDNWQPRKFLLPVPVPMYMPAPMAMFSAFTPFPIMIPVPIPVPCFIPTTKKSARGIMKKIKEMQEKMPSDPFEAELLMMADAVAGKGEDSDDDEDDDDLNDGGYDDSPVPHHRGSGQQGNSELAEDMLQMALRMASEMPDEPIMDLEVGVDAQPVVRREVVPITVGMAEYGTISRDQDIMQASQTPQKRQRAKRNRSVGTPGSGGAGAGMGGGGGGGGGGRSRSGGSGGKRPKIEPTEQVQVQQAPPGPPEPPADANMVLKFTYGVNAYKHWAMQKNAALERAGAPVGGIPGLSPRIPGLGPRMKPFKLDILQCTADELNYSLCLFVKEVHKPNGEEYAPDSIFYLCLGIQEYMYENGRIDNIFTDFYYERFTDCLNEVLSRYEVRLNSQGLLVCRIEEEHLWESKQLGAHSPHVLLNSLVYFNTKQFMLRTPADHLGLSFSHIMKHWKKTTTVGGKPGRSVYLRYYAPAAPGADGQKRKKEDMPVFEQCENAENPLRCPVKLYEFYLSKCPESIKNRNDVFYLVPERSCVPDSPVWYSTQSLGSHAMVKMLNRLNTVREIQESQLGSMQPYYT